MDKFEQPVESYKRTIEIQHPASRSSSLDYSIRAAIGSESNFNRWLFAQPRRTLDSGFSGGNVVDLEGTELISFRLSVTNRIGMILFKGLVIISRC